MFVAASTGWKHRATTASNCRHKLGSCYACLASAHDDRISVNVFNHCSTYVADVFGLASRRSTSGKGLSRTWMWIVFGESWMAISPVNYLRSLRRGSTSHFLSTPPNDTTFLPQFSKDAGPPYRRLGSIIKWWCCLAGTLHAGWTPFKYIDAYHICSFYLKTL